MRVPGGKLIRVARDKGLLEVGRRVIHSGLSNTGNAILRAANRFTPDHTMALSPEDRSHLDSNGELRNIHAGRRCFVLGNGPSLSGEDLGPLKDEITLVMNGFYENPIIDRWQPTYYSLSDPAFFDGSEPMRRLIANHHKVSRATFFAPLHFRKAIEENGILPIDRSRYILFRGELRNGPPEEIDLTRFVPGVWSVSELCIMVAIYLGCSPIYLLGLDHDWLAHRAQYGDWQKYSYKFIMEFQHKLWCGYESLSVLARKKEIRIANATKGSFLDIFEYVNFESIVETDASSSHAIVASTAVVS
jgi:hypothetical protein